jgi:pimeloyl-ACP methyl ester carboxylesterase
VCGWSFGANVALREALSDDRAGALALIGLPLEPADVEIPPTPGPSELRAFARPTLLLAGEGDVYCPRPRLESLARTMPNAELVIVPGTDHFLWHREKAVAETVGSFAVRTLVSADGQQG